MRLIRLRYGGMLLRALDEEIATGNGTPRIREHRAALAPTYDHWAEDATAATPQETIPFGKLAAVQHAAILVTSTFARAAR